MANIKVRPGRGRMINTIPLTKLLLMAVNAKPGVTTEELKEMVPQNYAAPTVSATMSKMVSWGWVKRYRTQGMPKVARYFNAPIDCIPVDQRPDQYEVQLPPLKYMLWPPLKTTPAPKTAGKIKSLKDLGPLKKKLEAAPARIEAPAEKATALVEPSQPQAPKPPVRIIVQVGEKSVMLSVADARVIHEHLSQLFGERA